MTGDRCTPGHPGDTPVDPLPTVASLPELAGMHVVYTAVQHLADSEHPEPWAFVAFSHDVAQETDDHGSHALAEWLRRCADDMAAGAAWWREQHTGPPAGPDSA